MSVGSVLEHIGIPSTALPQSSICGLSLIFRLSNVSLWFEFCIVAISSHVWYSVHHRVAPLKVTQSSYAPGVNFYHLAKLFLDFTTV